MSVLDTEQINTITQEHGFRYSPCDTLLEGAIIYTNIETSKAVCGIVGEVKVVESGALYIFWNDEQFNDAARAICKKIADETGRAVRIRLYETFEPA
jgi:hypothetical protein